MSETQSTTSDTTSQPENTKGASGYGAERTCPYCGAVVGGGDRPRMPHHLTDQCPEVGQ